MTNGPDCGVCLKGKADRGSQELELSCWAVSSVCIAIKLSRAVALQRCCWRGAFAGDLWFAQAHGKELASSSSRGATLGRGECLFRL